MIPRDSTSGARVKVLIGVIGLDQHEVGALVVSRMLRDSGIEVVYVGRFNTPEAIVRSAVDEDADVVGVSCHSWEFLEFAPDLAGRLKEYAIPLVLGGSVLTVQDETVLFDAGIHGVFGPRSSRDEIVSGIVRAAKQGRAIRASQEGAR